MNTRTQTLLAALRGMPLPPPVIEPLPMVALPVAHVFVRSMPGWLAANAARVEAKELENAATPSPAFLAATADAHEPLDTQDTPASMVDISIQKEG